MSNWSRGRTHRSRHNLAYWRSQDWWGLGPGAHSHVDGVRWWNLKHPRRWCEALERGNSPGAGREVLTDQQRHEERVLLELRTSDGLPLTELRPEERQRLDPWCETGHVVTREGAAKLTLQGRLLADRIILDLLA